MKKAAFLLLLVVLFLLCCCSSTEKIPDGIKMIDSNENVEILSVSKVVRSIDDFINISDAILKIKVLDSSPFSYYWEDPEYDYATDIIMMSYQVKVVKNFLKPNMLLGKEITIYNEHSPIEYIYDYVNLQAGNEYILFLANVRESKPKGLKEFVDYYIIDGEYGLILCKDDSTYLVHDQLLQDIDFTYKTFSSGRNIVSDPKDFTGFEILPQHEIHWNIVKSSVFEENLISGRD